MLTESEHAPAPDQDLLPLRIRPWQPGDDAAVVDCDARFLTLQELGYRVRGTPWFLVLATAGKDIFFFRESWYFTLGDTDLI